MSVIDCTEFRLIYIQDMLSACLESSKEHVKKNWSYIPKVCSELNQIFASLFIQSVKSLVSHFTLWWLFLSGLGCAVTTFSPWWCRRLAEENSAIWLSLSSIWAFTLVFFKYVRWSVSHREARFSDVLSSDVDYFVPGCIQFSVAACLWWGLEWKPDWY